MIWYASYGSNLNLNRFLCYIRGGNPQFSPKKHEGCRDKSTPISSREILIPHELYFAKSSGIWNAGAVAFIKTAKSKTTTFGRIYLITDQQFIDVVKQENGLTSKDTTFDDSIDLNYISNNKISFINKNPYQPENSNFPKWYGKIINLGIIEGYPVLTFTAEWDDDKITYNSPDQTYLKTIANGIRETHKYLSEDEIIDYFISKEGIKGKISKKTVLNYIT